MQPLPITNAGLIILNPYFQMLFDRLALTNNNHFLSQDKQKQAIQILQFVATGTNQSKEYLLPLNKILCGVEPSTPTGNEISISQEDKELVDGMIQAAIAHWPAIGESSVDGFRGNWLVRDGLLAEQEDKWELTVEIIYLTPPAISKTSLDLPPFPESLKNKSPKPGPSQSPIQA